MRYGTGILALLAMMTLIATQPLATLGHIVHDHLGEHSHAAHAHDAIHLGAADLIDQDAVDHHHVWTTVAVTFDAPGLSQPRVVAAVGAAQDRPWPSPAPLPPFSPPRA